MEFRTYGEDSAPFDFPFGTKFYTAKTWEMMLENKFERMFPSAISKIAFKTGHPCHIGSTFWVILIRILFLLKFIKITFSFINSVYE